jgi:hypothetical protein
MNMFKFLRDRLGSPERRALRPGAAWSGVAFLPWVAPWAAAAWVRAGLIDGLAVAPLVFLDGPVAGLMAKEK